MRHQTRDERLRVGLLLDSLIQPQWVAKMLGDITALPFIDLALVVFNDHDPVVPTESKKYVRWRRLWANRKSLLYALYGRFEERFYEPPIDPFAPVDIEGRIAGCTTMYIRPRQTKFCDYFSDEDIDAILRHNLDVVVRLGFRIIKGRALQIARYGVWSYHHGDNREYRGGPAGFWEVMEGNQVTGTVLQVLTETLDGGKVIHRMYFRTNRMSVRSNRANYYWKAAAAVTRKLRDLHERGPEALNPDPIENYETYSKRLYTTPTNAEMVRFIGKMGLERISNRFEELHTFRQWFLAYRFHRGPAEESATPLTSFYNFKHITPPPDRFWADPFPIRREGGHFIFLEEFLYSRGKGHISVMQVRPDGTWSDPHPVLEREYHLSYPHVFEWNGELFMIPETAENGRVDLYRCTGFPGDWELVSVLLDDIMAVDATVTPIGDRWWMFTNVAQEGAADWDDGLTLFHAPNPLGPWTPSRVNPVKMDVRNSRPAGRVFKAGGCLYRPAQDCSAAYGSAITINRILRVDPSNYQEVSVSKILPDWAPRLAGTHTINAAPGITVVDGLLRRRRRP